MQVTSQPLSVRIRFWTKSHAQMVSACDLMKWSDVASLRSGPVGTLASRRMLTTVDRQTWMPSFLNSPRIRV